MVYNSKTYGYIDKSNPDFRVVEITDKAIYIISLSDKKIEVPQMIYKNELEELIETGKVIQIKDSRKLEKFSLTPTIEQIKERDKKWSVIKDVWKDTNLRNKFLSKSERKEIYELLQSKLHISLSTSQRLMTQFLKDGMTANSLLDATTIRKRGPQKKGKKTGPINFKSNKRITEDDKTNIHEAYKKYVIGKGYSNQTALDLMIDEKYSYTIIEDEKEIRKPIDPDNLITKRQFEYWSRSIRDKNKENIAKFGVNKVHNDMSLSFGSHRSNVRGPGSVFQIDLTYLGISLISEIDGESIVSHPVLYSCIDVFSGMLVSFILAFGHESLETTKMCLLNMVTDKVDYCNRFGVKINEDQWPAHHFPSVILADNGRVKVENIYEISNNFDVDFSFSKSYSGRDKALIENSHGVFKRFLKEFFPCYDQKGPKERGKQNPKLEASLTYSQIMEILLDCVIAFNRRPLKNYPVTIEMQKDKIAITPISLWSWGIENDLSELREVDYEEFKLLENLMLPYVNGRTRVLRQNGIQFNNAHYVSNNPEIKNLFLNNLGKKVPVRFDPFDSTYIWFDFENTVYKLELSEEDKQYRGLSQEELAQLKTRHYDEQLQAERLADEDRLNLKRKTIDLINSSKKNLRRSDQSKSQLLTGIKENTKREAEYQRVKEKSTENSHFIKIEGQSSTPTNLKELRKKVLEENRRKIKNARSHQSRCSIPKS